MTHFESTKVTEVVTAFFAKNRIPCPRRLEKIIRRHFGTPMANQEECIKRLKEYGRRDRLIIEQLKQQLNKKNHT